MGLFGKSNKDGGILNVIRCDEVDYLVWKWRPNGISTGRENAIRWGSTLRVKEGEVAVFVYSQSDGKQMDFFEGPLDTTLKTANFPVLSGIIGSAFGGDTPFQAEVYFINISGNIRVPFFVNTFDLFDPRFPDFAVPTTVQGQMLINVLKYKEFTRLHRMIDFELEELYSELRATLYRHIKGVITSASFQANIPVKLFEIQHLTPGITVFGLSFMTLFSATIISKDRSSSLTQRLYTTPLTPVDFILGYTLPIIPLAIAQSIVCYISAILLGLDITVNIIYLHFV